MSSQRTKILPKVPSFPAIYAAALTRPPIPRSETLPDITYRVENVKIDPAHAARFDHLVGSVAHDLAHPGFLHVLAFPVSLALIANPRFPVPLMGLVHVRNEFLQHRPIKVGETLDIEVKAQNLKPHRRGRTFEVVHVLSSGGDIVATDVSTYIARGSYGKGAGAKGTGSGVGAGQSAAAGAAVGAGAGTGGASGAAAPLGVVGAAGGAGAEAGPTPAEAPRKALFTPPPPTARWKLGANAGRLYAGVSGDNNPIHMSALTAKAFGFPGAIVHGMYSAARAFSESRPDLSHPFQWDVEFRAPVILPATVWVNYSGDDSTGGTTYVGYKAARGEKKAREHFHGSVRPLGG